MQDLVQKSADHARQLPLATFPGTDGFDARSQEARKQSLAEPEHLPRAFEILRCVDPRFQPEIIRPDCEPLGQVASLLRGRQEPFERLHDLGARRSEARLLLHRITPRSSSSWILLMT